MTTVRRELYLIGLDFIEDRDFKIAALNLDEVLKSTESPFKTGYMFLGDDTLQLETCCSDGNAQIALDELDVMSQRIYEYWDARKVSFLAIYRLVKKETNK